VFSCISALVLYFGLFPLGPTKVILASATKQFAPAALQVFENSTHRHPNYASEIEPEPAPVPEAKPSEMVQPTFINCFAFRVMTWIVGDHMEVAEICVKFSFF
jgi:hypothetical protein